MIGLSTTDNISFNYALVAGKKRVPRPAAGNTALRTLIVMGALLGCSWLVGLGSAGGRIIVTVCWWSAIGSQKSSWEGSWMSVDQPGVAVVNERSKIPILFAQNATR